MSKITMIIAGTPGLAFVAGQSDLNRVPGVPIPELRHAFVKEEKFALPHSMDIPIPPATAIGGVALMMNLPAAHAM